jgi:hypothetical protein
MKSFTSSLSSIVFHGYLIRVGPDNAVVGTVNVAVRFALLDEEPETICSAVSKHHFIIINPYFPYSVYADPLKPALNKLYLIHTFPVKQ